MPSRNSVVAQTTLAMGPKFKTRAENFVQAVLSFDKYRNKIEAQWTPGNDQLHYLVINKTTRRNLLDIINNQTNKYWTQEERRQITDSKERLERLGILTETKRPPNSPNEHLCFKLALPSQQQDEIMRYIFEEKWPHRDIRTKKEIAEIKQDNSIKISSTIEIIYKQQNDQIKGVKISAKLQGNFEDAKEENIKESLQAELFKQINNLSLKRGSIIVEFECSLESWESFEKKIKSGELTKIDSFPILEVNASPILESENISDKKPLELSYWFDKIEVNDWLYDIGTKAARLAVKSYNSLTGNGELQPVLLRNVSDNTLQDNQVNINHLLELLNSNDNQEKIRGAYELGNQIKNFNDSSQEIINALANAIETTDDQETSWQLALTLGKLDPEHLKGAVAQKKKIQLAGDRLELFLALRISEDDLIGVMLQVYHTRKDNLPVGLKVSLLDETEEIFPEKITDGETITHFTFDFRRAIGEFFSIKFSLGDNEIIEDFQI